MQNLGSSGIKGGAYDVTGPATDEARRWYGYGTDVKPANEPAVLARKPLEGTLAENLLKWGTGALHIDAARHAPGDPMWLGPTGTPGWAETARAARAGEKPTQYADGPSWGAGAINDMSKKTPWDESRGRWPSSLVFCPKVSRRERNWGCEGLPPRRPPGKEGREDGSKGTENPRAGAGRQREGDRNFHPTLKPIALCRWFVRLLAPGPGSVIVDTFAGSGSLVAAAVIEGHRAIGIEREGEHPDASTGSAGLGYFAILEARAAAALIVPLDTLDDIGGDDGEAPG
jgi:site-specific DNA-methyltransferase (adenine-specific)